MQVDRHQEIRHIIDRSLVGAASSQEEQTLREHLPSCAACQGYLKASHQAIAGLEGFSFEVNPDLHGRVLSALTLRAQQLETTRVQQRPMLWSYLAALVLTVAGSFTAARFSGLAGAVFHIDPEPLHIGLLALWIVPSLCFCLLFPVLHRLSVGWTNEKGLSQ
jgi:predicted anti-sigma-YlaC factor YlaD